uniref:Mitogen-activated protein kinase kinase kinase n=1 Tax=Bursaphelenchus xylophilus TaxID=6326 RepID=A0A1I7RLA6_BURXY
MQTAKSGRSDVKYDQVNYSEVHFPDFSSVRRLGRGSYGTVVQGLFRGRPVAVKLLESDLDREHIDNEAKVLHSFKHENIIRFYATFYGLQSGLLLELMEGGSLHELLHQNKHIQYFACHLIGWAQQVLSALSYLHSHGYVHRDLKPSNMLLTNDFITLKLCDFGTATELRTSMTNNRGSAAWMAPEVFRGKRYDQKCDIFSFGIFLWEMTARRQPFSDNEESNAYTILWQVSEGKRPPKLNCPPHLMTLMERCWNDKPLLRPDVEEIVKEIDIVCAGIYPNRYMPLIDKTSGSQAFARPPNVPQNYSIPPPYPGTSNYHLHNRSPVPPPIPPPPRINGHIRTSSHDFNLYGRPPHPPQRTSTNFGQAVDYHPLISPQPLTHHPPPHLPIQPGDIGWRRSSEPPLSDSDSGYGTNRPPKPKKKDGIRNLIGHLADSISKHL